MRFFFLLVVFSFFLILGCSSHPIKDKNSYSISLDKKYLEKLDFDKKELVVTSVNNQWFYVKKDGKAILAFTTKNGEADIFHEGLARTIVNGKIGFFNKNLDMVLDPFYDFAFPFYDGVSEVCIGCKEVIHDDGNMLDGGTWKRINRAGLIIEE